MSKERIISFRVSTEQKSKLQQRSEALGMKLTNYIELVVLEGFDKDCQETDKPSFTTVNKTVNESVNKPISYEDWLSDELLPIFQKELAILKKRYPEYTDETIITACVMHAEENHRAWIQGTLKSYLKQIKKRSYDD